MSRELDIPILDEKTEYTTWKKKVDIWKLGDRSGKAKYRNLSV